MIATCAPFHSRSFSILFLCWITFSQVGCKSAGIGKIYAGPELSKLAKIELEAEVEIPLLSISSALVSQPHSVEATEIQSEATELQPESEEESEFESEFPMAPQPQFVETTGLQPEGASEFPTAASHKEEPEFTAVPRNHSHSTTTEERFKKALEQAKREAIETKKALSEAEERELQASSALTLLLRHIEGTPGSFSFCRKFFGSQQPNPTKEEVEEARKVLSDAQKATQEAQARRKIALKKLYTAKRRSLKAKSKEKLTEKRTKFHCPVPKEEKQSKEKNTKKKKGRNRVIKKHK